MIKARTIKARTLLTEVQPSLAGKSFMVRYADDAVIGCEKKEDADQIRMSRMVWSL
jgi:hypothetical protein